MSDPARAVADLDAAGESIDELRQAIEAASFLDDQPGPGRQKLRASRGLLRRLERGGSTLKVKAEKAKEAEAASNAQNKQDIPTVTYEFIDLEESKKKYSVADFDKLWEGLEKLRWRMIQMPGGAIKKPDAFYWLHGLGMQATKGDNEEERPMWAEKGGLDFEGRARWDEYTKNKGMDSDEAKQRFVEFSAEGYDPKRCLYQF